MKIIKVADDFWNIRGSFKLGGMVDIGTHASLVRCQNGRFVFLDSLTLSDEVMIEVQDLTDGGEKVDAVLNLHPFHTVHVQAMREDFHQARFYGSERHVSMFPDMRWEPVLIDSPELQTLFEADFEFSVPRGVDFISDNPKLHFSSVLALHRASQTIHVDDTLMYSRMPKALAKMGLEDMLTFHPTLAKVLERRPGAADDFRAWANSLISDWGEAKNLCAAHTHTLLNNGSTPIAARIENALRKVEKTLVKHQRAHG